MRYAVIGSTGQLGSDLATALEPHGDVIRLAHRDCDITDAGAVEALMSGTRPDVLVNCAAFHKTDECERQPDQAYRVNATAVRDLARACERHGAILVHFSSDYVFDGEKGRPYVEEDRPQPLSTYGVSKLAGECLAAASCTRTYLFRCASLFGAGGSKQKGGNFVDSMIRRAAAGEPLRVVDDIVMSPTSTRDAAEAVAKAIAARVPFGLYHAVNAGSCSWCGFARAIVRQGGYDVPVEPTRYEAAGQPVNRPRNSALEARALAAHGITLPPWEDGLRRYLRQASRAH